MEIKCPHCGSKNFYDLYDYEITDDSHLILYYTCDDCGKSFEAYCEIHPIEISKID